MKWIIVLLAISFSSNLLGQVTLSEEEAVSLAKKTQELEITADSLNKIVILQNKLIFTYKETIIQDSTTISSQDEKINILENDKKLLEEKTKLVKPSWYENKWLYFTYGAILSYGITDFINTITNIL